MRVLERHELDFVSGSGDPLEVATSSTSTVLTPEQLLAVNAGLLDPRGIERYLERDATARLLAGGWANCSDLGGGSWSCVASDTATLDQSNFFQIHGQLGGNVPVYDLYQQSNLTDALDFAGLNVGASGLNLNMVTELQQFSGSHNGSIDPIAFAEWLVNKYAGAAEITVSVERLQMLKDEYEAGRLDAFVAWAQWQVAHIETASYLYNDYFDPDDFRSEDNSDYFR